MTDDARRLANVRPADWQNPAPADRYHLVVIGAGTAGLVSAAIAAGLGARVALVERHELGGDCLNVGCVPSKAVLRAARAWHEARTGAQRFGAPPASGDGDFAAAMARMRRLRADISRHDAAERFRSLGVDVFLGEARLDGPDAAVVGDGTPHAARLRFRRCILATGGRAAVPPVDGLAAAGYLTNETVFDLDARPARLLVLGGGPIGCELAQAFARFGSAVTLLDSGDRLLPRDDPDAGAVVARALAADGVRVELGAKVVAVRREGATRVVGYERAGERADVAGDALVVAVGRAPNVERLGLDAAGVRHGKGGIEVDDRFRTSSRRVFAIGDCASRWQFTHAADAQARLAVPNALFFGLGGGRASGLVVPWCTYTSPEVAQVGLTAEDAARDGAESVTVRLADVDRAVLDGESDGFLRVHLARGSDRIVGATLVAEHAGETISELTAAMVNRVGLSGLGRAIHPYPTVGEAIRKAADAHRRTRLTPRARALFAGFFRAVR